MKWIIAVEFESQENSQGISDQESKLIARTKSKLSEVDPSLVSISDACFAGEDTFAPGRETLTKRFTGGFARLQ